MGHTGPRANCTPLVYSVGRMDELFKLEGGVWTFHPEKVDAKMASDMGDLLGALHQGVTDTYPGVVFPPWPKTPDEPLPNPVPPQPQPGDPLARVKAAPSQWAKWFGLTDAEAQALIDGHYITRDQKNINNNWWGLNGVKGRYDGTTYYFYTYPGGVETTNVDATVSTNPTLGKADGATESASGQTMPGPALP